MLGKIRLDYVNWLEEKGQKIRKSGMHMLWIYDFPLFEEGDEEDKLNTVHHPFTAPHPEDLHLLESSPLDVSCLCKAGESAGVILLSIYPYLTIFCYYCR